MGTHERRNEHTEQQLIETIAQSRFPECTGITDIQPFLTGDPHADYWLVILTTQEAFSHQITLVTNTDIQCHQQQCG